MPAAPEVIRKVVELPSGFRSSAVARYLWQLDDQSRRLVEATSDLSIGALSWQLCPGANTMGMLFAHVAVAEVHLTAIGLEGRADSDVPGVIGISADDDGLPLPEHGAPPAALAGKDVAYFHGLLARARENTRRAAFGLADPDLDRRIHRRPADGIAREYNVDWILYHLVEHLAGHHAQILQLKHLYRATVGG